MIGEVHQREPAVLVQGLVHLEELTVGENLDPPRFAPVKDDLAVLALQRQAQPVGDHVRQDRGDEVRGAHPVRHVVQSHVEVGGDEVGAGRDHHDRVERHSRGADRGAERRVTRTVQHVVLTIVLGEPPLDPGPREHEDEYQGHGNQREQDVQGNRPSQDVPFPVERPFARHQAQTAVRETHVPVRLGPGLHGGRVVRAVVPDRVDGRGARNGRQDAEHDEEEATGLGRVDGTDREADHVVLGASRAGELGVLVHHDHEQVHHDHHENDRRDEQHVHDVETPDDRIPGELAAEHEHRDVGTHHGDGLRDGVRDAQPVSGEHIVRQGVAREAGDDREQEQRGSHDPVQLTGPAEGAGEEHAEHVDRDGHGEQQRGPVVALTQEEPAADVEGDLQRRSVRPGHLHALHRNVASLVRHRHHGRVVPEGQEGTGQQQDDEAVERHLTEHEGPVVGEDLAPELLDHGRGAHAGVDEVGDSPR